MIILVYTGLKWAYNMLKDSPEHKDLPPSLCASNTLLVICETVQIMWTCTVIVWLCVLQLLAYFDGISTFF